MDTNVIDKIRNLSLEEINKNLILIALFALIYRVGNFYNTFIPKPFEIVLVLIIFLTLIDLIINKKFKKFFLAIDRNIWVALAGLVFSVIVGWLVALFVKKIPLNLNVILEFGTFIISIVIFVLILSNTNNDKVYAKRYLYALLLPVIYVVFVLFPEWAYALHAGNSGTFLGFTMNPNIISKILLVPTLFFMTHSLFNFENRWTRVRYITVSAFLMALLFWTASRGGLISLVISLIFLWLIFSFHYSNWKKTFFSGIVIFMIFLLGFILTPGTGKQRVILRALYPYGLDTSSDYLVIKDKPVGDVVTKFINTSDKHFLFYVDRETRFQIWPFYLKQVLVNPLGIGPNTHFEFNLRDYAGEYVNTGPHNTFLQIWLWGGLLGILSFLYIFISAFRNLKDKLKSNFNPMALSLTTILFGLSISIMFDDSLGFFWFFIILALALRYDHATN